MNNWQAQCLFLYDYPWSCKSPDQPVGLGNAATGHKPLYTCLTWSDEHRYCSTIIKNKNTVLSIDSNRLTTTLIYCVNIKPIKLAKNFTVGPLLKIKKTFYDRAW